MFGIAKALGWISGNRHWLTLLAVAAAAAFLFVRGETFRMDRDRIASTADGICAAAGSGFQPEGVAKSDRGKACRKAVERLAAFERETRSESARVLSEVNRERETKTQADIARASSNAQAARDAQILMEKADGKIANDDRVDGGWFDAFNRAAGLRPPR
ncbi:hypothetical protein [Sphingomonas cavernae]|uniref:Uncharacterized protein n=1 Tax=Sphingomonas cavernae TaxID=2320861 RepID=A0A418WP25_9SPHN|nr:hypothetical protein [Sphingomonas cavernae]RJF92981.1 hypothetical protein D3876_00910 [Sphingomonas cavernae]